MLTKSIKKRLFLIFSSLFIILIICLFPVKKESDRVIEKKAKEQETIIYLLDPHNYIGRVAVITDETETINKAKEIINYLTVKGTNTNYLKEGFTPLIPQGTKILSIDIDKDLIKINFSNEFLKVTEENEDKMISSIIFSLTSLDKITKVSIYVDGNILNKLPNSKKQLNPVLDRSYGINQVYDFTTLKGTTKTTVYYLSKYKDYYYYVPVTMINNKKEDKIEIIIEELSSKSVYETSMISYLKDAKEISYQLNEEDITLNLNKALFDSLNDNNLMETVIYTINLSIKDNYDIKKVIYTVDNNLFKTCQI